MEGISLKKVSDADAAKIHKTVDSVPAQDELIQFGISNNGKLELVIPTDQNNDYNSIGVLRDELLAVSGPLDKLTTKFHDNSNIPQANLFAAIIENYRQELAKDIGDINFTILYARGARFYTARTHAQRQVDLGEWPELDADISEAIDTICDLHGPLIMGSFAGSQLVARSHEYEATAEVYRREQNVIADLGNAIASETDLVEDETREKVVELSKPVLEDTHPERSRVLGTILASSSLVVIVGGSALYAVGAASIGMPIALTALGGVTAYSWHVLKKTKTIDEVSNTHAKIFDDTFNQAKNYTGVVEGVIFERLAKFVTQNADLLRRVSELRPEFSWAKKYIPNGISIEPKEAIQEQLTNKSNSVFVPFTSPVLALEAYKDTFNMGGEFSRMDWENIIGSNRVLADLKKLELVEYPSKGRIKLCQIDVNDKESMFKHAVSRQHSIQICRDVLINDPSATASDICSEITLKLGKKYQKESTVLREGNALLRWTRWLEPHLIDPSDKRAAMLRATAKAETGARGRAKIKTPENLNTVAEILLSGGTRSDAASKLGTTTAAISNWIAAGIVPGVKATSRGMRPETVSKRRKASLLFRSGMSFEEIGNIVGVKTETVQSWNRRGLLNTDND